MAKLPIADVFISSVTEAELCHGLARRPDASRLQSLVEEFLLTVTILPWDSGAAKQYGRLRHGALRAGLEHEGLQMANSDQDDRCSRAGDGSRSGDERPHLYQNQELEGGGLDENVKWAE